MLEAILTIVKFAAIGITRFRGCTGVVVDYKDDEDKVTKWGRLASLGVIALFRYASRRRGQDDEGDRLQLPLGITENLRELEFGVGRACRALNGSDGRLLS